MQLTTNGYPLDTSTERFGELADSSGLLGDDDALRAALHDHGYLFFRGLLKPDLVLAARHEILTKYAILGEIDDRHDIDEAIASDGHAVPYANLRAFSESVRAGHHYRSVTDGDELLAVHEALLGGPVRSFDFRWPRFVRPTEGCGFHCDGPYMNRGTSRIVSSWIPLGRVNREEGALGPAAQPVHLLGRQLLAGAGLSLDQQGDLERRQLLQPRQRGEQRPALTQQS